jgi:iron complex transport system substrate-binding protein
MKRCRAGAGTLLLPLAWAFAAAAVAAPGSVTDDAGASHHVTTPPQRIVSLMPSLTEAVVMLGAGAQLVGVDRYSNWPAEVRSLPQLGGLDDVAVEALVRLRPDVVLASASSRAVERLTALGVPVLRFKSDSYEDLRHMLGQLARLLGRPGADEVLWQRLQADLDAAAARVPATLRGQRVLFEVGGGYVAGPSSFIGQTLRRLGLESVVDASMGAFPRLNPEALLRARPQIVLGAQVDVATLSARPGWAALPVVTRQRWCGFEPARYDVLVRPGPRLGEAAVHIADCLETLEMRSRP